MSMESSIGHGGRRKGSGRKKKKDLFPSQTQSSHAATSILSHPLTSNHAQQLHIIMFPDKIVYTNSELNHLRNEVEEVMNNDEYAEIRIQEGRVIDESISDTMDDSMEGNAEAAAAETEETKAAKRSKQSSKADSEISDAKML
ncbi:hypothetical protein BT96DRAFT_939749 [Gymnopus androsaceus JB14]|uniref:Uncharacterized protein n=1 Tax=Gymnopus androsaceus JB14 TaxID=1447944 RepID=A0A6A4HMH7_9AGAR|nr:hypothetical protein BT96DRAFT_939749 [Gymnopus androsaceus JB14]